MKSRTSIMKSPNGGFDITIHINGERHTWWLVVTKSQANTFALGKLIELGGLKAAA